MANEYQYHPACLALPKMDAEEFAALCESISKGFDRQHPITLFDGMVLDGRHRIEACNATGIDPVFITKTGIDPYNYVRREHAARRSWKSQEQKALVIGKLIEGSSEYHAAMKRIRDEANKARSDAAQKQHKVSNPRVGETKPVLVVPQCEALPESEKINPSAGLESLVKSPVTIRPLKPEPDKHKSRSPPTKPKSFSTIKT